MPAYLHCLSSQNYIQRNRELSTWINVFWLLNQISVDIIWKTPFHINETIHNIQLYSTLLILISIYFYINTKMINWCMSSRHEVLIIVLVLLQRSLKSHIKMLKTALFDCAINVKCCSVDGGRTLFSSPPWGIWQLNSPHHWVFTVQGTKNANARGSAWACTCY